MPATVGIFFVPKKGGQLRMIADTRLANMHFRKPYHSDLPTASLWSGLELNADEPLFLSQVDVQLASYRIRAPPGMSGYLALPAIETAVLRAVVPGVALPDDIGIYVSPVMEVLAMGFSWSLVDDLVAARRAALTAEGDRLEHEPGMGYMSRAPAALPRSNVATLRFGAGASSERPASHFAVVARDFVGSMQAWQVVLRGR